MFPISYYVSSHLPVILSISLYTLPGSMPTDHHVSLQSRATIPIANSFHVPLIWYCWTSNCHWYWSILLNHTAADFTQKIMASSCTSLNQLSGKTTVIDKGPIKWDIEDVTGTCCQLKTHAYYVPTAIIHLFSPQVYIGNNDKAPLSMTSKGTYLTLKCGNLLQFPLNP